MPREHTYEHLERRIRQLESELAQREQAEESLREKYHSLSSLVANLPGLAYRCKNDERFTSEFISDGCFELTGYKPSELLNNPDLCYDDLTLRDGEGYRIDRAEIDKALAERQPFRIAYRIRTASGETKWVYEQGVAIYSDQGEVVALEGFTIDITDQKQSELALRKENIMLRSSIKERYRFGRIIGKSPPMQRVYDLILKAASTDANVVIFGETGTGKELVARAIHDASDRASNAFVPVNCGAIPDGLVETEFFGHKKGAFTGAHIDKHGYLHHANGGTLFLDEVSDIGLNMQTKLLGAIENEGYYTPVGDNKPQKSDFHIISATNTNLSDLVKSGRMREDFFYRISVIPITLPPLRERKEDIPLLIEHMLRSHSSDKKTKHLTGSQMETLQNYDWPGNVRELQNVIQRFLAVGTLDFMGSLLLNSPVDPTLIGMKELDPEVVGIKATLEHIERNLLIETLNRVRWNRTKAASMLGISRKALFRRMRRVGLYSPNRPNSVHNLLSHVSQTV